MPKSRLDKLRRVRRSARDIRMKRNSKNITGLLLGGGDHVINKGTGRAELVNKHFVRKDPDSTLKSDEDNELVWVYF